MKTHLPLLLRKALFSTFVAAAAVSSFAFADDEDPIDNLTYGWDYTEYYDHDILFYKGTVYYGALLIGNGRDNEDPIIVPTTDWDGEFSSINAFGQDGTICDIYVECGTEIRSYNEVRASDSIIMDRDSKLTGFHVQAENSVFLDYSSTLNAEGDLNASTLVLQGGNVNAYGFADLHKADQYRSWELVGHYAPLFEDYYEESGPTPFADDEKGCSILITDGGVATFNKGLRTKGNVYLHGNSHLAS